MKWQALIDSYKAILHRLRDDEYQVVAEEIERLKRLQEEP